MTTKHKTTITKEVANKRLTVVREFDAPVDHVWKAWTESQLLDQWWAPKPWKAITKSMDFREGGLWLYCMEGPDGSRHWARIDYETIDAKKSFKAQDSFCDENGAKTDGMPSMNWNTVFTSKDAGTSVQVTIDFPTQKDLEKIIEMGFEQGFSMALDNLDELLETLVKK